MTFDRYRIENDPDGNPIILSSDGTGTSYRAVDSESQRSIILRVLGDQALASDEAQRVFVDRARFLIELDHPQITRISDTGQSEKHFFYVLSDPGGPTLFDQVRHRPFELEEAIQLNLQLVETLLSLNPQPSVINRVWPRNLLVTPQLKLYVVAQNLVNSIPPLDMPEFAAPEVLRGSPENVQSTLYSIGSTFYFMLTGRSPYPGNLRIEDLIRIQAESDPDYSLLPASAPITLINQLLHKDPRERPGSLQDWDRALQRYIRFTPSARGGREAQPVPMGPKSGQVRFSSEVQEQLQSELSKIRAHTQRLSLELTKRVEKELALTERLKMAEAKLEEERQRNETLLRSVPPKPDPSEVSAEEQEKQRLAREWKQLEKAKKELSKEKEAFLKKTQRLKLENPSSGLTGRISLWKQRLKEEPPVSPAPVPPPTPKKATPMRRTPFGTTPATSPTPSVAPPPQAPKVPPVAEAKVSTPSKAPSNAKVEAPAGAKANAPISRAPSDQKLPLPTPKSYPPIFTKDPPAVAEPIRLQPTPGTKAPIAPQPRAQQRTVPPAPLRMQPPAQKAATEKATPLGRGWIALAILTILFLVGLYKVYRTFYDRSGTQNDPMLINLWPSESGGAENPPAGEGLSPASQNPPLTNAEAREARINGEMRVEVEVIKNFRLIQDHEWGELLQGIKQLESKWKSAYPDSLKQVQTDLLDDMNRAVELKPEAQLEQDDRFVALRTYLTEQLASSKP